MGLLDWFRRRRKKKIDEEKEVLVVQHQELASSLARDFEAAS